MSIKQAGRCLGIDVVIFNTSAVNQKRRITEMDSAFLIQQKETHMLSWEKLLNPARLKDIHGGKELANSGVGRKEHERDYDRILFAAPTRRLADKTQVFPMEENDSVRNRLTHSHEVSNLARSIGIRLAFEHADEVFGQNHEALEVKRNVPAVLAAVGLAHDLGNPPFGHQGEEAIQQWFHDRNCSDNNIEDDFLNFDGNAQTFRLLTKLQVLHDKFGLNLTVSTLAALLKYPSIYGSDKFGRKKHGIFKSETDIITDVWEATGLNKGIRHPFAYIMEACDDIAYSVIDAEDTVKKGYASFYDLINHLENYEKNDASIKKVIAASLKNNNEFKEIPDISSNQLNDISMQMFRVHAISQMIPAAADTFRENIKKIMSGEINGDFELISQSNCSILCKATKDFDIRYGFRHRDVLKLELQGSNYIKNTMTMLWQGICNAEKFEDRKKKSDPFEKYVYGSISENYRRIYNQSDRSDYAKRQLLCDAISGMTESYLIKKHDEFKSLANEKK